MKTAKFKITLKPLHSFDCLKALKALSDPRRIMILNLLLTDSLTVGAVAEDCGLTTYTASRQLAELQRAGLLVCTKNGQHRIYGISPFCDVLIDRSARIINLKCCQFRLDTLLEKSTPLPNPR